ncbi:MAG: MBL fold metallo-hydrolase [Acidobacteriota bacterium]
MGIGSSAAVALAILALLPGVDPPHDGSAAVRALGPGRVRFTVVYDNVGSAPGTVGDWGFSCLVEREGRRILFDTGRDPAILMANLRTLGIAPDSLDAVVISHPHADHSGGLAALVAEVPELRVYLPFASDTVDAHGGSSGGFVRIEQATKVAPGMVVTRPLPAGADLAEMAMVVTTQQGLAVITGCAHPGIVDMVAEARRAAGERGLDAREISLVMGGFHLRGLTADQLGSVVRDLHKLGVQRVAPSHCTGEAAVSVLASAFGPRLLKSGLGSIVTIGAPPTTAARAISGR